MFKCANFGQRHLHRAGRAGLNVTLPQGEGQDGPLGLPSVLEMGTPTLRGRAQLSTRAAGSGGQDCGRMELMCLGSSVSTATYCRLPI